MYRTLILWVCLLLPLCLEPRIDKTFTHLDKKESSIPIEDGKPNKLRILTYNIWNGFDWGKDTLRRTQLLHWINEQQPHVVALQELCNYTPQKLAEDARAWNHNFSVLLKTTGYSVGLTSKNPIELKEKIRTGLHHGALHGETYGIEFLVIHLHPGSIARRRDEAKILLAKLEKIKKDNENYIVLGDYNGHSPFDADLYNPDGYFMTRLKNNNEGKGLEGNLDFNELDYMVLSSFLSFPLYDVVQPFTQGLEERGSFPGRILGKVNQESSAQLVSRLERIDYILVSSEMKKKCTHAEVYNGEPNWFLSDHYPVLAEFDYKSE